MLRGLQLLCLACGVLVATVPVSGQTSGPDVIVGDLLDTLSYGSAGGYYAYAVGTTSCNVGSVPLTWIASTNAHPVIGQAMYRLRDGRFEMIGLSWLKHGFTALQQSLCQPCAAHPNGSALGVGCSDPYVASLNGSQNNGPRHEVNATTGIFPYPYVFNPPVQDVTSRRLRVHADDLDPGQNAGAEYFVEGQYVHGEDSSSLHHHNNASWRRVTIGSNPNNYPLTLVDNTVREEPAILAWQQYDPAVQIDSVVVENGKFFLGSKVTSHPNGTWTYEYALHNLNSDRCAQSFSIPLSNLLTATGIGFHDVEYHSGAEQFQVGTDWSATTTGGNLRWGSQTFAQNANANALRWGTMYNFRFTTSAPPVPVLATVEFFKPGPTPSFQILTQGPDGSLVAPVSGLVCQNTGSGAELSWTNGDTYDSISLRRNGVVIASNLPGSTTSFSDPGLPDGPYNFSVVASIGVESSSPISCAVTVGLTHTLRLPDVTAVAGQTNLGVPLIGGSIGFLNAFSASIQYPSDLLTAQSVSFAGTAPQAAGADFMQGSVGANFITVEVAMDVVPPVVGQELPAGFNQTFAWLNFAVTGTLQDGDVRPLDFVDGLGSGVLNQFEDDGSVFAPLLFSGTATYQGAITFVRGDCDRSGSVALPDAIVLLNYLFAFGAPPACFKGCDADDNSGLQLPDAIWILNYLFAGGAPPPAPFPAAGPDPTPDNLPCT